MKKKIICLFISVMMLMGSFSGLALAAEGEVTIQVLATSDIHGKFYPYDYALNEESLTGSSAQIASVVNKYRNENTLLIDAGDTIQGNTNELFLDDKVHPMVQAMNDMKYDFWTPGNHEFNFGVETMQKILKESKAKILMGNVADKNGKPLYDGYTIIERSGIKIAVIGMVTPNIVHWDSVNLKNYKVTSPLAETRKIIEKVKGEVDLIIATLHMSEGSEYGDDSSGVNAIADACPEIDLIIAAHEHKLVTGVERNKVLIVENKDSAQTVARVNITLKKDSAGKYEIVKRESESINVADFTPDESLMKSLASYNKRAVDNANTVIGKLVGGDLVEPAEIEGIPQAQIADSALLDLINKVQIHYSGADVSAAAMFQESAQLKEGQIKKSDTSLIYKYTNTLYKLQMNGAQLKKYMEWSSAYFNTYQNGDLTISFNKDVRMYNFDVFSGVSYDINISKEAGKRIENLKKADGTPVKDSDVFIVAVNNYRANTQLLSYGVIFQEGEALPKLLEMDVKGDIGGVRELIGDYITNVMKGTIKPEVDNNWKITGNDWDPALHLKVVKLVKDGAITIPRSEDGRTPNIKSITIADIDAPASTTKPASSTEQVEEDQVEEATYESLIDVAA